MAPLRFKDRGRQIATCAWTAVGAHGRVELSYLRGPGTVAVDAPHGAASVLLPLNLFQPTQAVAGRAVAGLNVDKSTVGSYCCCRARTEHRMFGSRQYGPEFRPERGGEHAWHVRNADGAIEVLRMREFEAADGHATYTVNFANGSCASVRPGDPLWSEMADVAREREIRVYCLTMQGGYVPWTGDEGSLRSFDAIEIARRPRSTGPAPEAAQETVE